MSELMSELQGRNGLVNRWAFLWSYSSHPCARGVKPTSGSLAGAGLSGVELETEATACE